MNKNTKTYIALDLDGTLITDRTTIDADTFNYLRRLNKYHPIIIATGRPYRSSKYYYDLLELNMPIINYNGSYIHHPIDSSFPTKSLFVKKEVLINFFSDINDVFINAFCEIRDDVYLWEENEAIKPFLFTNGNNIEIGDFANILPSDPHGAILITKPGSSERLLELVNTKYYQFFNIRIWYSDQEIISEIYHPQTSKANALQYICDYYQISPNNLIAIGDGHNDLEMITFAKLGIAVANARKELLEVADCIIPSVENNGVLAFLKTYFKNID
ncbi:MAG TPA: Cof-type HAD-IIB family hydrolase [Bacilli bacterium]|nr:Cof-type HAD-IIB family hydrolase [Bacilli bacterium]HQA19583.1 Cof-type HAD-IIB family hydrolase [Bacilli bacterium]HQD92727.1 Cof-type HAD-IIB family hydrolase [Bacilli bacterium]